MNPNPQNPSTSLGVKSQNAQNEEKLLQFWCENNVFEKTLEKDSPMGEYHFFEGPPTANGRPGIHHVGARSFKDVIPRYKTMRGFRVNRKAGWDTHGLPVELQVEKALGLKSKKEIEAYGVAAFNQKCKESVWTYKDEWEKLTERMGYWLDMQNPYVTYNNSYIEALWATVKRADERGHLYKDFRVGPWCPRCGTTLSSHELNQPGAYKDVKDLSVYVKFPIIGFDKAYFLAWTTTPWTLPGNVGLAVGADIDYVEAKVGDEILVVAKDLAAKHLPEGYEIIAEHKGSEMVGMQYEPLFPFLKDLLPADQQEKLQNAYKVYAADFVTTTDGTGIVHTAVMYGADDFELGTKVGLPKFHTVNEEGKFAKGTGFLEGRYVKEVDENGKPTLAVDIVNDLTARNLLFKKENYLHSYPHCWRCDTPLIYYARTSWYFNMSKLRDQLVAANQNINWEPDHVKSGRFGEWLDGIKDWAISRDRYWGTPLPVWSTESGKRVVIGGLADLKKYAKKSGNKYFVMRHGEAESNLAHVWSSGINAHNPLTENGVLQVKASAETLKDKKIDMIIASPVMRTKMTAEIVAETLGISKDAIVYDMRLREINPGDKYQGQPLNSWLSQFPKFKDRFLQVNPDGESYRDVKKRITEAFFDFEKTYQGKNILVVAHGGPLMGLFVGAQGMLEESIPDDMEDVQYPRNAEVRKVDFVSFPHNENYELDFHKPFIDDIELELDGEKLTRTPEVMDVWFDSGAMPIAQNHVLGGDVNFDPASADYIAEGMDQTRGWFYTMHAIANMLHDDPTVAYKNAVCMGLLMDANGQKMSKSRGNVVDPWSMFDKYGADVVRFWFYSVNQPGETKNFDEKGLDEVNKKVFNLLRNVVSFYEMYIDQAPAASDDAYNPYGNGHGNVLDLWILAKLHLLVEFVTKGLEEYQPLEPARAIREFIGELSTWYIRRSRDRFKSDDTTDRLTALKTTRIVLNGLAKVMAPFTPFIAEEIWQKVNWMAEWKSVHLAEWPNRSDDERYDFGTVLADMEKVRELVTLGLEARQKANIKVRQPLAALAAASEFSSLSADYLDIVKDELNVKQISFRDDLNPGSVVLDTEITDALRDEGDMRELVRKIQDMRKDAGLEPKDRVVVMLTQAEPAWYASLGEELCASVGAERIEWGCETDRVEKV